MAEDLPAHLIRNPITNRCIDARIIIAEMKMLHGREHWRNQGIAEAIERWRQTIIRDTGYRLSTLLGLRYTVDYTDKRECPLACTNERFWKPSMQYDSAPPGAFHKPLSVP
jgi:hypothetical protein